MRLSPETALLYYSSISIMEKAPEPLGYFLLFSSPCVLHSLLFSMFSFLNLYFFESSPLFLSSLFLIFIKKTQKRGEQDRLNNLFCVAKFISFFSFRNWTSLFALSGLNCVALVFNLIKYLLKECFCLKFSDIGI